MSILDEQGVMMNMVYTLMKYLGVGRMVKEFWEVCSGSESW